jgi:PIN domain nuclease of toxin-antitoxin system
VLDSWAVLALLKGEPSGHRVGQLVAANDAHMSAVNLGEVLYSLVRSHGERVAREWTRRVGQAVKVEGAGWDLVKEAALIKAGGGLAYADAFCIATARRHRATLVTGDPEIVRPEFAVEVLDLRTGS